MCLAPQYRPPAPKKFPISQVRRQRGDLEFEYANLEADASSYSKTLQRRALHKLRGNDNNTSPEFLPVKMGRKSMVFAIPIASSSSTCSRSPRNRKTQSSAAFLKRTPQLLPTLVRITGISKLRRIQKEAKPNSWQPDIVPLREAAVHRAAKATAAAVVHADATHVLAANIARAPARMSSAKCASTSAVVSKWGAVERK